MGSERFDVELAWFTSLFFLADKNLAAAGVSTCETPSRHPTHDRHQGDAVIRYSARIVCVKNNHKKNYKKFAIRS